MLGFLYHYPHGKEAGKIKGEIRKSEEVAGDAIS